MFDCWYGQRPNDEAEDDGTNKSPEVSSQAKPSKLAKPGKPAKPAKPAKQAKLAQAAKPAKHAILCHYAIIVLACLLHLKINP